MKKLIATLFITAALVAPMTAVAQDKETYISQIAQEACVEYGEEYGLCPELLMAMIETESSGNPEAKNGGCIGLMQISERWHRDRMGRLGVTDLHDEKGNILVGADYLSELAAECGEVSYALDVYNGNSKAEYYRDNGIMSEYATKILERSEELERLHGK